MVVVVVVGSARGTGQRAQTGQGGQAYTQRLVVELAAVAGCCQVCVLHFTHVVCFTASLLQAFDALASFYEACAQIEIDEYRDYEKALQVWTRERLLLLFQITASANRSVAGGLQSGSAVWRCASTDR
jgi:hypothetical protein